MLSRTLVYFVISKLMLLFSYSFHVPCITRLLYVPCFPFLFNQSQLKASVVNQMSHLFLPILLLPTLKIGWNEYVTICIMKTLFQGVRAFIRSWVLKEEDIHKLFLILGRAFKRGKTFIGGFTLFTRLFWRSLTLRNSTLKRTHCFDVV